MQFVHTLVASGDALAQLPWVFSIGVGVEGPFVAISQIYRALHPSAPVVQPCLNEKSPSTRATRTHPPSAGFSSAIFGRRRQGQVLFFGREQKTPGNERFSCNSKMFKVRAVGSTESSLSVAYRFGLEVERQESIVTWLKCGKFGFVWSRDVDNDLLPFASDTV
ncbi:hypothetical protein FB451DRAFT_1184164 [Mycena latifolia]|nr:hypothetical protein FB451DRAFT_1184164 [Mycena latifolia]